MSSILTIKINIEALSLNRLYPSSKSGRRFLSKEGSDYKKLVSICTRDALNNSQFIFDPDNQYISSEAYFYSPKLITKTGKINKKKPDTDNLLKALFDSVFETLGIDDYFNIDVTGNYRYSENPMIVVILRVHSLTHLLST